MYQIKFTRAGRPMDRDFAIKLITDGLSVSVAAVSDHDIPHFAATILTGTDSHANPCAYVSIPAVTQLNAADMHAYASVASAAQLLAADADKALSDSDR